MFLDLEFLSGDNDDDGDNIEDDDEDDDGDGLANAGEFSSLGSPSSYWNAGMFQISCLAFFVFLGLGVNLGCED